MKQAIIKDGEIVGVIMLAADANWTPPAGSTVMPLSEALAAQIPYAELMPTPAEQAQAVLNAGFLVQPEGFRLALLPHDIQAFTQLAVMLPLQLEQEAITPSTLHKIKDKDDAVHEVQTDRLLQILAAYGAYVKALWDASL